MITWRMAAGWVAALVAATVLAWEIVGLADSQVGDATPEAVAPTPTSTTTTVADSTTTTVADSTTSTGLFRAVEPAKMISAESPSHAGRPPEPPAFRSPWMKSRPVSGCVPKAIVGI